MPNTRLFFRVEFSHEERLGPGKIRLLEMIGTHGSISGAARAMDMSYRRAWLLVDALNRMFDHPSVSSQTGGTGGGAAVVTPFGKRLIKLFRTMEQRIARTTGGALSTLERHRSNVGGQTASTVSPKKRVAAKKRA